MPEEKLDTNHKALQINLDATKYGTFAEIGAGQEVARRFFRVGGASGTVAKTISAYDMAVSDAIYGPADRYVSRKRLQAMVDYEFNLLLDRLHQKRGEVGMSKFAGPAFAGVHNRLMALQLVQQWLTEAAWFTAAGETVIPGE